MGWLGVVRFLCSALLSQLTTDGCLLPAAILRSSHNPAAGTSRGPGRVPGTPSPRAHRSAQGGEKGIALLASLGLRRGRSRMSPSVVRPLARPTQPTPEPTPGSQNEPGGEWLSEEVPANAKSQIGWITPVTIGINRNPCHTHACGAGAVQQFGPPPLTMRTD